MSKKLKILLCSDDDGLMVKTIKSVISNRGFEENIVLVRDQHDVGAISKEIVDADVVYPDKAMITREMIMSAKQVRLFQYGTGYDTIDLEAGGREKGSGMQYARYYGPISCRACNVSCISISPE